PPHCWLTDCRLHTPAFAWHLIISLAAPRRPVLQPFRVAKGLSDFGISDQDAGQGSELAYQGPEVAPLALAVHGPRRVLRRLTHTLHPPAAPAGAGSPARPQDPPGPGVPALPSTAGARPGGRVVGSPR